LILIPALGLAGCVVQTVPVTPPPLQAPAEPPPLPPPPVAAPVVPHEHLVDTSGKTDVALLVPLTGPLAGLGHDLLDAGQLAVLELGADSLVLTPKDTKGTAAGAADAARRAIAEGARLIAGPLTAAEVEAVRPLAKAAGINVLAFSNVAKVAGDGVFVLGFLPQQEAARIARYAVSTGLEHLAVLAPANDYGNLAADSFKAAGEAAGATVDPVDFYQPGGADLRAVTRHLAEGGKFSFTAILLAEPDGARLRNVATALPAAEIDPTRIRLLGTSQWDQGNIGQEPTLVGAWYAATSPEARAGFEQRFAAAFGHAPRRLATLAYDAVGVAAVLERTPGAGFTAAALENPSGFAGADGIFRLHPDGTAERGLAVLQVGPSGATTLSPAPESFAETGQ
jgi:branched-chain amino acid transport system substrate-binding protein